MTRNRTRTRTRRTRIRTAIRAFLVVGQAALTAAAIWAFTCAAILAHDATTMP